MANCPPDSTIYIAAENAQITLQNCAGATTLEWGCPPTKTVGISAGTDTSFSLGCTLWSGTGSPLPVYTTWPPGELVWVTDTPAPGDKTKKTTCKLWFFFVSQIPHMYNHQCARYETGLFRLN